jgi:hypothetical protein
LAGTTRSIEPDVSITTPNVRANPSTTGGTSAGRGMSGVAD